MDVFKVHEQVIEDYRAFTSGFVEVRDERIKALQGPRGLCAHGEQLGGAVRQS